MVYIYDEDSTGKYKAELQDVAISINEFGGDAGSANTISYDVGSSVVKRNREQQPSVQEKLHSQKSSKCFS